MSATRAGRADVSIDLVGAESAAELARVHQAAFGGKGWSPRDFEALMATEGTEALLARSRNGHPGGLILYRMVAEEGEILTIGVVPPWRRGGVGGRLLGSALSAMMMLGARRVFLEVGERNIAARALYEGMGFEVVGRRADYYDHAEGGREDALVMVRHFLVGCGD